MKLKKFDFKLPKEEKRQKKIIITTISVIALILVITIASTFAYYQSIENQNPINTSVGEFSSGDVIFAVTIDGEPSNTFPTKGSGYVANSVTCDKGAIGVWNNESWEIEISNLSLTKTICNIDFIDETGTLEYKILAQFGGKDVIDGAHVSIFNSVSAANAKLMYKMEDDYGDSYYYRGAKTQINNNLIFAGFQWKIIRINGDSSVRLIYNGVCLDNSCTINNMGTSTQIGASSYNLSMNDPKYVGYMYGGANGVASTSLAQAVTNQTSSNVKNILDTWYANNIITIGTSVTSKISDTLFCNDRQLAKPLTPTGETYFWGSGYGGSEYASNYSPHYRLFRNKMPTLKCAQQNDRFTVNDAVVGNADLTYPVGLISADEIALSGGVAGHNSNTSFYLYNGQTFWTMSPYYHSANQATMWVTWYTFIMDPSAVITSVGIRPSINLVPRTKVTGDGSESNPFIVI